mgnify:CR=1 FL=1
MRYLSFESRLLRTITVLAARKPFILLNVSASGHAHASHLFTMPKNGLAAMASRNARGASSLPMKAPEGAFLLAFFDKSKNLCLLFMHGS